MASIACSSIACSSIACNVTCAHENEVQVQGVRGIQAHCHACRKEEFGARSCRLPASGQAEHLHASNQLLNLQSNLPLPAGMSACQRRPCRWLTAEPIVASPVLPPHLLRVVVRSPECRIGIAVSGVPAGVAGPGCRVSAHRPVLCSCRRLQLPPPPAGLSVDASWRGSTPGSQLCTTLPSGTGGDCRGWVLRVAIMPLSTVASCQLSFQRRHLQQDRVSSQEIRA